MICPNFSNPSIRKDFYNLVGIVGEDFAYYLWDKNNGLPLTLQANPANLNEAIANPLFEALDEQFSGNSTKATLGVAITFSSAFQKKYVGFNRATPERQVQLINDYINKLDITLEQATQNYIKRANQINRTFKRAVSVTQEAVTREDLSKDPNSVINQIEDVTAQDRTAAYEFLKRNKIAQNIRFTNAQKVVNSGAYAQWTKHGLTLFKGSDYTDIYHESWHEFTQWYLSPIEKALLYNTVRNREGTVTIGDLEIPYYSLTNRQVEEVLAEEFRAYSIQRNRNKAVAAEPRIRNFFERMYDFLKWLFFGPEKTKKPESTFEFENVSAMFSALYEGNVDLSRRAETNIVEDSLNRSTALTLPILTDEGLQEIELSPLVGAEVISYVSYSIYKQMRDQNIGMSLLLNPEHKKNLIPQLYTAVRAELNDVLDNLEIKIQQAEASNNMAALEMLEDQYANITALVNEDEAWNRVVALHQSTTQGELFNIDADVTVSVEENIENRIDEAPAEEKTRNEVQYGDKSNVNPLELYDPYVIELIKSLPDLVNINGQVVPSTGSTLGLPKNGNFKHNKNLLQNILSGSTSYEDAIQRLIEASSVSPQLTYLIQLLPSPVSETLTLDEITLKNQFMQALSMPRVDPYSVKAIEKTEDTTVDNVITSKKVIQFNTFYISTLTQDALLEYLDNEFQISAASDFKSETDQSTIKQRSFVNKSINGLEFATFSTASVLDAYKDIDSTTSYKTLFEFMNDAFGVDLYQGISEQYLFDKRGDIIIANSPYTESQLNALTQVIVASYNKIKLYHLINNLEGKSPIINKLKNEVPSSVETPAKTYISDVKKSLVTALNTLSNNFNTLNAKDQEQFKEIVDLFTNSIKNNNNLRTERQILFRAIENYYNRVVKSASYLNDENNMEWSIREWQHVVTQASSINNARTLADLTGHLNPATNNFVGVSKLLAKAFSQETGERKLNRDEDNVLFELVNISGYSTKVEGKKTINLNPDDKLIQDFIGFLKDGLVENLRFGAKSTSLGVRVNGSRNERLFYDRSRFSYSADTDIVRLDPKVMDTFLDYLRYELNRMFDDRAESTEKEKRGFDLIILKDILPNKVQEFKDIIKNSTQDKETTVNNIINQINTVNRAEFDTAVTLYFNEEVRAFRTDLEEIIGEGDAKFAEVFGTKENINEVIADYVTHYYTQQIEFLHLFVGDPSNFQVKGENWRELFKRLGASISPGKQPLIDSQFLNSFNNSPNGYLGRGLERLYKQSQNPNAEARVYDENFTYVQYKDVKSFTEGQAEVYQRELIEGYANWLSSQDKAKKPIEAYRQEAADIFKTTIDGVTTQKKEADGQAYATLDFVRFYLNSIGEWTPKQEAAYQHELKVAEKILEYRATPTETKLTELRTLIQNSNAGILLSLKLGYWGSPIDNPNYITLGKYSVAPLIPSTLFETDLEDQMSNMLIGGVDFITFDSGNKMALPVSSLDFYKKEGKGNEERLVVNDIPQKNIVTFPISGLRRQQYIAPKFKEEATLSTQLVKLVFSNFYTNGELNENISKVAGLPEKIDRLQKAFINDLSVIVESEKAKIYAAIGAELKGDKVTSIDAEAFSDWIKKEFDKKDVPQSVYDYLIIENNNFKFSLDVAPHRALFESVLASALSKRVLRPKMFGEALVQVSSLGFNQAGTRFTNPTREQVRKYGNSGLRDYGRIVNGKHQPADIKIAFNSKKYGALLNLDYKGSKIETLDRLNEALLDDAWVELHSNKITLVGVRIPVQGLNSMEHFRVRQFLPEVAGPIIIVPPSLVTKSGSDFDIDKLFMYEPELDSEGNFIERTPEFVKNPKAVYQYIRAKKILITELKSLNTILENKRQEFIRNNGSNTVEAKVYDSLIASNGMLIRPLKNRKKELTDGEENTLLEEVTLATFSLSKFLETQKDNPEIKSLQKKLKKTQELLASFKGYSIKSAKAGASNGLIQTISEILSEPAIMPQFLQPNDSPILKQLSEDYKNNYGGGGSTITSTSVFSPRTSIKIFRENATGKKALGIDAKTNALHKLYQQVGLQYTNPIARMYLLKSNKTADGHIILGGLYDANNEYLISDIINEFINGHVDIEKEEWINFFNADKNRTSVILQMVLSGTPIKDAVLIANQPIVQHFLKSNKLSETAQLIGIERKFISTYIAEGLRKIGMSSVIVRSGGRFSLQGTIEKMLKENLFSKALDNLSEANFTPSVENTKAAYNKMFQEANSKNQGDLAAQLVFLSQYYVASVMNEELLALTSVVDFNTASYRNLNDFHLIRSTLNTARENFNESAVNQILQNSVLAPFNITNEAMSIGQQVFDLMGSREYQDMLNNFVNFYGDFWTPDQRVTEVNNFNNAVVHALIQRYSELDGEDFYTKFGPKSNFLTKGATGNLFAEYITLFGRGSKVADANLKSFVKKNLFLRNFRKKDVEKTKKFYIATLDNEKDVVFTNEMQKSFTDGLFYDKSTPEINERVQKFFSNLANATIVGQGFSIKFRSIHPYLPIQALDSSVRASLELRRIKGVLFTEEAQEKRLKEDAELQQNMIDLLSFIKDVEKIYARNTYSKRVKSLNYWKFFPDYVSATKSSGIRISSKGKKLNAALSLNTAEALKEKRISGDYKIDFRGKQYADAGKAYNAFKTVYAVAGAENEENISKARLLREIFAARFRQHLNLFGAVYNKGGADFLLKSSYNEGDDFLKTNATSVGAYVQSLADAYNDVEDEMLSQWLEFSEKQKNEGQPAEIEDSTAFEPSEDNNKNKALYNEDGGVDFDDLDNMTAPGMKLNSTTPKKANKEVPSTISTPIFSIKLSDRVLDVSYAQATPEFLSTQIPTLTQEQLQGLSNHIREKLQEDNPNIDFSSEC